LHVLSGVIDARKHISIDKMGLEDEKFSLYRNYFAGKMHSQDISTVYYGMRGLKNLVDQAFLQPTHSNIVSFNGETINLSYKAVDAFG
jgi:hypothetical protein